MLNKVILFKEKRLVFNTKGINYRTEVIFRPNNHLGFTSFTNDYSLEPIEAAEDINI